MSPEPSSPIAWITATEEQLLSEVEVLGKKLSEQLIELGLDTAAHQRKFWDEWAKLPGDLSIAARNRQCEYECRALAAEVIQRRGYVAAISAKYDAVTNDLAVRCSRPMHPRRDTSELLPTDQGMSVVS